jgi:DNA-binding beta-propeller fold protein YncE
MTRKRMLLLSGVGLALAAAGMARWATVRMGKQPDGSFMVSSGQRIEPGSIAFDGRPIDLAVHPSGAFYAVLNKGSVFLGTAEGLRKDSSVSLGGTSAGFRGLAWSPDGRRLYASTAAGHIQEFLCDDGKLRAGVRLAVRPEGEKANPVPGGIAITRDGKRLFVAAAERGSVVEVDLTSNKRVREYAVQNLPFEPRLSEDEKTLVVSNWGGRPPRPGEKSSKSLTVDIVVDERGIPASGTVSLIDLASGSTRHLDVGVHPTALAVSGGKAYVANASSDSVSEIDIAASKISRTLPIRWGDLRIFGAMPNALAIAGGTLYVADGGDNALAEVDLDSGKVRGFRPVGYFPTAVALGSDGKTAFVLNTKGNGSVAKTVRGLPGNAHDFQGTVTAVDLTKDLAQATATVARNNHWEANPGRPSSPVYNGAIKHVIYVIKENRTYDEVFGDFPQGEGDPKLCSLGEKVMPNHRKIAREFTLFDNGYVSGTNSADGHNWSTQSLANDYLEHFYVGYSRTYPDDGRDPMALSAGGAIWDAALKKGKTIRVYGEFCDADLNKVEPKPRDWFEVWEDRKKGGNTFKWTAVTRVASLKPHINPEYHYWPLLMSDQQRADIFLKEYDRFSRSDTVPDLMILSLPCDHGEGLDPKYPTPRAMMADNDLALGRIVEAVSNSPQWRETCIFVIEDDAQSGPDHIDGHRTVFSAISPYSKRKAVDSTFYTTANMLRSIEMMLGLDPMTKFDAVAYPLTACFDDTLDLTPYRATPNNVALDERNPFGRKLTAEGRYWQEKSLALDWSHIDAPDPYWLNRINWYSIHGDGRPYPGRQGEQPGVLVDDD